MVKGNRYQALIGKIFSDNYKAGATAFEFGRGDLTVSAAALGIELPKNLGDVIYSVRFRSALPPGILATQPPGMEWIIEGA
ncbi:MAG: endonuclease, partial [Rhodobacter sp.]|nr:endonuclease [Rhodobacter sp.]